MTQSCPEIDDKDNEVKDLREAMRRYYNESREYLDAMQSHDDAYFGDYLDWVAQHIRDLVGNQGVLVDIGCGGGATTHAFSQRLPEFRCTGLDISEPAIEHAGQHYSEKNLSYQCADCYSLPFEDASVDAVTSRDVIEHLPDVPRALNEMMRILRPGGILLIRSPHHRSPLFAFQDLLRYRTNYPFVKSGIGNLPRGIMLSFDFVRKSFAHEPRFHYRTPDLSDSVAVGHDADAVYEVCSLDLIKYLKNRGFEIKNIGAALRKGKSARILLTYFPLLASIGLVAQKPADPDAA